MNSGSSSGSPPPHTTSCRHPAETTNSRRRSADRATRRRPGEADGREEQLQCAQAMEEHAVGHTYASEGDLGKPCAAAEIDFKARLRNPPAKVTWTRRRRGASRTPCTAHSLRRSCREARQPGLS